jgi:hypothetical protein
MPGLYAAYSIYDAGGMSRTVVEARVLANEAPARIAAKSATTLAAIGWYERIFYDVRPYRDNVDYIVHHVIRSASGGYDWDEARGIRLLAYRFGASLLDLILQSSAPVAAGTGSPGVLLADAARANWLRLQALATLRLSPSDPRATTACLKAEATAPGAGGNGHEQNCQVFLEQMDQVMTAMGKQFCVGPIKEGPLAPYVGHARELRDHEMMAVALGIAPPEFLKEIQESKFPEPDRDVLSVTGQPASAAPTNTAGGPVK